MVSNKFFYLLLLITLLASFAHLSGSRAAHAFVQNGALLQGRVVNESDLPQAGATVSISLEGVLVQSILTSGEGTFTIYLPRPGQYNVTINMDGFRAQSEMVLLNKDEPFFHLFKLIPSSLHVV